MAMRRVTTLVVECVIVACVSDLFQAPGSHGSAVSRAGMSSCTNRPTTVFWLISPSVMWLDSSFEKLAHSFLKAFLSRSSSCQRLLKICLLVVVCVFYCHLKKLLWAKLRDYAISRVKPIPRQAFLLQVVKLI